MRACYVTSVVSNSACVRAMSLQSCPTLSDPIDHSPPGSSVDGVLQARILEWVAMPSFRGSSPLRDRTCVSWVSHWQAGSLPTAPPWKPYTFQSRLDFIYPDPSSYLMAGVYLFFGSENIGSGISLAIQGLRLPLPMQRYGFNP